MVPQKSEVKKIGFRCQSPGSKVQRSKVQEFVKLVLFVSLVELVGLNRTN
jgi:hypothetical protein